MRGSLLPSWDEPAICRPVLVATMRRYLQQVACSLRPGNVSGADLALRCFVTFLLQAAPDVMSVAGVSRRHIEDYKPWLASRPGRSSGRVTVNTIAHRLGTLRMFFVRIDEWDWDEAPGGCRSWRATCRVKTGRCPRHWMIPPRPGSCAPRKPSHGT